MTEQLSRALPEVAPLAAPLSPAPTPSHGHPEKMSFDIVDFARSVADLATEWQQAATDGYDRLAEIVAGSVGVVPGCEHAALVLADEHGRLVPRAVSGPETGPMIDAQNELDEGPCRDTALQHVLTRSASVADDERWPRFAARAAALGVGSMLCTPLTVGHRSYGSLSMASSVPYAFDSESEVLAGIFAAHAAVALADAARLESLYEALDTRDLIGQAKGIVMSRYGATADVAFGMLVQESQNSNVKLRTVCERVCETRQLGSGKRPG